jgi:hypothetical protein
LKQLLVSPPILAYPEYGQPFILHTDASGQGLGAILYQEIEGKKRVIAYASRGLSSSERNYPVHKLEFLALKWAVTKKFHDYLHGASFIVFTDNNPMTYVLKMLSLMQLVTGGLQLWQRMILQSSTNQERQIMMQMAYPECHSKILSMRSYPEIV